MSSSARRSQRLTRGWATTVWVVFIALFFLWQTVAYRGFVAFVAEWQFNEFGIYRPTLTYFLFVVLLAPLPLLFRRRAKRNANAESPEAPVADALPIAVRAAYRFMKVLFALSGAALIAALLSLLAMWLLPSAAGQVQHITASDTVPAAPSEGPTALSGKILYNRTSAFDENLWFVRRNTRFAPVIEEGSDETAIRYFVELAPTDQASAAGTSVRRGILKRNALPGELLRLYRYAGFRVFPDHYVLFSTPEPMRWPYFATALEFITGCVLLLLVACIQWLRCRRLAARLDREQPVG